MSWAGSRQPRRAESSPLPGVVSSVAPRTAARLAAPLRGLACVSGGTQAPTDSCSRLEGCRSTQCRAALASWGDTSTGQGGGGHGTRPAGPGPTLWPLLLLSQPWEGWGGMRWGPFLGHRGSARGAGTSSLDAQRGAFGRPAFRSQACFQHAVSPFTPLNPKMEEKTTTFPTLGRIEYYKIYTKVSHTLPGSQEEPN